MNQLNKKESETINTLKCNNCNAEFILQPGSDNYSCPFCLSDIDKKFQSTRKLLKPKYILPFKISRQEAQSNLKKWLKNIFFISKHNIFSDQAFQGIYLPFFVFDLEVDIKYQTQEINSDKLNSNLKNIKTSFNDIIVKASNTIKDNDIKQLEPWDFTNLELFKHGSINKDYKIQVYQLSPEESLRLAKNITQDELELIVIDDMEQAKKIESLVPDYHGFALKYVLLPVWISTYKSDNKINHFFINARTGEVIGIKPPSRVKFIILILVFMDTIALIAYLYYKFRH